MTYIFDFDREIYGEKVRVNFLEFIRPEMKFEDIEKLKEQMHKDRSAGMNMVELYKEI